MVSSKNYLLQIFIITVGCIILLEIFLFNFISIKINNKINSLISLLALITQEEINFNQNKNNKLLELLTVI